MTRPLDSFTGIGLYTAASERKYLTHAERLRFLAALPVLECRKERSFCEMIYWTGCRPSEARALTALNIDLEEEMVVIRSLKKRGRLKNRHFRPIPLPQGFMCRLEEVHDIRLAQSRHDGEDPLRLWNFSRTKGWRLIKTVMEASGITGAKGCSRGLRHAYGVHAAIHEVPESRIKKWLGHESLDTTAIYLDVAGPEDRTLARRMWGGER